jgi:hypothetical protein
LNPLEATLLHSDADDQVKCSTFIAAIVPEATPRCQNVMRDHGHNTDLVNNQRISDASTLSRFETRPAAVFGDLGKEHS